MKWQANNGLWANTGEAIASLPPGVYNVVPQLGPTLLREVPVSNDELMLLPDSGCTAVAQNIKRFWDSEDLFKRLGLAYKRGVLFHGAPGTGKTATISLLSNQLVAAGGVVIVEPHPGGMREGISLVRAVEPKRQLICVMEDIDAQIPKYEEQFLSLLSGQDETSHVVFLATTNDIGAIPGRLRNRPSRFDEVVEVLPPSPAARDMYLARCAPEDLLPRFVRELWVSDTEGFTLAHLRELVVGVIAMARPYQEVLARLHLMQAAPKDEPRSRGTLREQAILQQAAKVFGMTTKAMQEEM